MAKRILIDSSFGMVRTALAEGGDLIDYYEESPEQGRFKGNIYRGVVKRVDAPIQAAFVKFAGGRDGFLPLRDASAGKPPRAGETVLVQVVKDEVGDKGAALTTKLSLSGRYLVYIPERGGDGGVSSKLGDNERAALKKALDELRIPGDGSVILRTAASDKSTAELQADLDRLLETHREILEKFGQGGEPGLLFREAPPALRYLREYYTDDVERIWVNQEDVLDQCRQFFYLYEPASASKVALSQDGPLLFQRLGLEAEVEKLSARKVPLPSGANIVIDQTEALVAIDVNSAKAGGRVEEKAAPGREKARGKAREKAGRGNDLEETAFAVNLEAAAEVARQLRLRDLGGIVIVDFIDMEDDRHRRKVEEAMRHALARDKAKVKVFEIGPLGIMQISRQRLRKTGHQFTRLSCEACQGRGWHPSPSAGALTALRRVVERLHGKKAGQTLSLSVPYPVANKLMNEFREHVAGIEKRYGCALRLQALPAPSGEPSVAVLSGGSETVRDREERPSRGEDVAGGEARAARGTRGSGQRTGERRQSGRGRRPGGREATPIAAEADLDQTIGSSPIGSSIPGGIEPEPPSPENGPGPVAPLYGPGVPHGNPSRARGRGRRPRGGVPSPRAGEAGESQIEAIRIAAVETLDPVAEPGPMPVPAPAADGDGRPVPHRKGNRRGGRGRGKRGPESPSGENPVRQGSAGTDVDARLERSAGTGSPERADQNDRSGEARNPRQQEQADHGKKPGRSARRGRRRRGGKARPAAPGSDGAA